MRNLAPDITRQRILIEGFYRDKVDKSVLADYFRAITEALKLRMYGKPMIFSPSGLGRDENQGYAAFVPLIDSGISVYIWSGARFFSVIIYSCKAFDNKRAVEITKGFFNAGEIEFQVF